MEDKIKTKINIVNKFIPIKNKKIRVRFAPSPTGFLHVGGVRTALFNYLFAKKNGGKMILRIEDTDTERSKKEFEDSIIEGLKWLGINWDEGPTFASSERETKELSIFPPKADPSMADNFQSSKKSKNKKYIGNYGPYRQSERKNIYKKYITKLLKENKAYYCFCTKEELEAKRQEQISRGIPPHYDGKCSNLSHKEIEKKLNKKQPFVIRIKIPKKKISFIDMIRGKVEFDTSFLGDIVIAKDIENPLYNLASVIDDFEMNITHIIRGEDHLSNTPKQILIQEALGFKHPFYAHIPLILGPDRSKLSKRHGAVAIIEYKEEGYLAEALINFLAFLGWNPGTKKEIYSLPELIKDFSIEKIQKSGAIFNIKKLDYLNGFYIRKKSLKELTKLCIPYFLEKGFLKPIIKSEQYPPAYGGMNILQFFEIVETKEKVNFDHLKKIVSLYQERLKKISEITDFTDFFFKDKLSYQKNLLLWKDSTEDKIKFSLDNLLNILNKIKATDWNKQNIKNVLMVEAEKIGDRGILLWPLRIALTGKKFSAGPFEIAEILGKEKTLKRIKIAKEKLKT